MANGEICSPHVSAATQAPQSAAYQHRDNACRLTVMLGDSVFPERGPEVRGLVEVALSRSVYRDFHKPRTKLIPIVRIKIDAKK